MSPTGTTSGGLIGEDYQGLLQSDGFEGYSAYCKHRPAVTWLGCWAHLRRHYFEAQSENPRVVLAVLRMIARMYRREAAWTEEKISTEERTRRRQGPEGLERTMNALHKLARRLLEQKRVLARGGGFPGGSEAPPAPL